MPELNITTAQPEIPDAGQEPVNVKPLPGTPLTQQPAVITSTGAKQKTQENLDLLNELTGGNLTL